MKRFTVTDFCQQFISNHIRAGSFCVDATAGNGHDTEFLCRLAGNPGKVLAFDIQELAVKNTLDRLTRLGLDHIGTVILDSHAHLANYVSPNCADCIMFNFGYLPGGDHQMATKPETSLSAIRQGLECLKPGGLMSLCIYSGGDTGFEEKDALLSFVKNLDPKKYLVIVSEYANRAGNPPVPVFIFKEVL